MFEGFLAVPLHFTVEFLGFLVTAGGAALVLSRPNLVPGPSANRIAAALGLVSLAVAQVLHGGSFYPSDGDQILVAIRALGFALLLIGIVGDLKPTEAVAPALWGYEIKEGLLFAPAGAALLVALAALPAARRPETRFYTRLALAALLLSAAEALTAAAPDTAFGGGEFDAFAMSSHGVKFVGYVLLGAWLWTAVRSSIRTRFVASFGALLVAVILALSTALTGVIANNVQTEELRRVATQAGNAAEEYSFGGERVTSLKNDAVTLATRFPEIGESLAAGSGPADARASELMSKGLVDDQVDFVILDPTKATPGAAGKGPQLFKKGGEPKASKLRSIDVLAITGTDVVREVDQGNARSSASPQRIDKHAAVIAAHSVTRGRKEVGVLILGQWIDALTVENISTGAADAAVSLFVRDRLDASLLGKTQASELSVDAGFLNLLRSSPGVSRQESLDSNAFYNGYAAITDGEGNPAATLVISNPSSLVASTRNSVTRILFLAAMLVGVIALALAYVSGRRITRPIQSLTATASAVREGDLSARAEVEGEDEVGQLGETFNEMTASLVRFTDDLRRAARQEHDLRERIETIINSMADGLVAVDADLNVLAFNPEAENITGVPADEAVGAPVRNIVTAVDGNDEEVSLPIFTLSEGTVTDIFIKPREGDRVPVAIASAVLQGEEEGEITGAVAVIRNMTREREVERMKTEFLSNISHELRTPLTPIKGYAEILGRKKVPHEKVQQFVGGILDSTARLERIVELLVDFSAMEAGRLAPRSGRVDMRGILSSLAERWDARAANHEVVAELPEDQDLTVTGDERLLRRSLDEIVDNAVKFSPRGGQIRLSAHVVPPINGKPEASMIEVAVTDPGIGIAEEELPRIFSDFHQLDGSETRSYGGLGLGLAFVQRVVEAHQGTLSVQSQLDSGSRFSISLPAAPPEEDVSGEAQEEGEGGTSAGSDKDRSPADGAKRPKPRARSGAPKSKSSTPKDGV